MRAFPSVGNRTRSITRAQRRLCSCGETPEYSAALDQIQFSGFATHPRRTGFRWMYSTVSQPSLVNGVDRSNTPIEPCVLSVANQIAPQALSYAENFVGDPCVAMSFLEEAAATVSEVVRAKEAAQVLPIRDLRAYLYRAFLRRIAEERRKEARRQEAFEDHFWLDETMSVEARVEAKLLLKTCTCRWQTPGYATKDVARTLVCTASRLDSSRRASARKEPACDRAGFTPRPFCGLSCARSRLSRSAPNRTLPTWKRLKNNGGSYLSSHDLREVLGIGGAAKIDELEIHWPLPSKRVDKFTDLSPNRYIRIVRAKASSR